MRAHIFFEALQQDLSFRGIQSRFVIFHTFATEHRVLMLEKVFIKKIVWSKLYFCMYLVDLTNILHINPGSETPSI